MSAALKPRVTLDEFLAFEGEGDTRYQLIDGEIVAISPPLDDHGTTLIRTGAALLARIPSGCAVVGDAGIVRPDRNDLYFVADIAVRCTPKSAAGRWVERPVIIVEVLSPSTAVIDRGTKVPQYCAILSVDTILLLQADERHATVWQRDGNRWIVQDLIGQATIPLPAIGAELSLDAIYGAEAA